MKSIEYRRSWNDNSGALKGEVVCNELVGFDV